MAQTRGPAPTNSEVIARGIKSNELTGYLSVPWGDWAEGVDTALDLSASVFGQASVTASGASIGTTPITTTPLTSGLYRVSYYLTETQADNVGSSIIVTVSWTDGGTTRTLSSAALLANSVLAAGTGTFLLRSDAGAPVTYSTTYATTGGAPPMLYALQIILEQVA